MKCQTVLKNPEIRKKQLAYIQANLTTLNAIITRLEKALPLYDAINLTQENLKSVSGLVDKNGYRKFKYLLRKTKFSNNWLLLVRYSVEENVHIDMEPSINVKFKPVPVHQFDVECTFSGYKHIWSDRKHS